MHAHPDTDLHPLRQQLDDLLRHARINEEKMQRMDGFERQLIGAGSLEEILEHLLADYPARFGLQAVRLSLVDPCSEIRRILGSDVAHAPWRDAIHLLASDTPLTASFPPPYAPHLSPFEADLHTPLLGVDASGIRSLAALPLVRNGRLIGALHLASSDPERYGPDCGTTLLERLAGIIAVCIESMLAQERLKQAGLTDGLTGVQNRRYFEHRCLVEISQSRRYKHALACMFLDIDKFKRINDTYGHQSGDEVLRKAAGLIQNSLRAGDTIARYGGEEFVVLLPQTSLLHAKEVAERIRRGIETAHFQSTAGQGLRVTLSIGLSMLDTLAEGDESSIQTQAQHLVSEADRALYLAKENGRNRVIASAGGRQGAARTASEQGLFSQIKQLTGLSGLRL